VLNRFLLRQFSLHSVANAYHPNKETATNTSYTTKADSRLCRAVVEAGHDPALQKAQTKS
jgi:hypothetical protein